MNLASWPQTQVLKLVFRTQVVLLAVLLLGLVGCSSPSLTDKVPAKADLIVKVDLGSVAFKAISWQDIWTEMTRAEDSAKTVRPSIAESGLDLTGDYVFFRLPQSANQSERYVVLAPLSDDEAFKKFILNQPEFKGAKKREAEGIELIDLPEGVVLGVEDDCATFIMAEKSASKDLTTELIALIKSDKKDSWSAQNDRYTDLMDDGNDIALFMKQGGTPSSPDLQVASRLSFEQGKVVFDADITGEEARKQARQLKGKKLSPDFMEGIKLANPNIITAVAFNTDSLATVLNSTPATENADQTLNGFETSISDLIAMWDGQLGFLGNINPEAVMTSTAAMKMGVKDQKRVEDWLVRLTQKGVVKQLDQNKFITALFGLELELLPGQLTMSLNRTDGQAENKLTEIQNQTFTDHNMGLWISPELIQSGWIAISDSAKAETKELLQDVYLTADITAEAGFSVDGALTFKQAERQSAQLLLLYARHARFRSPATSEEPSDEMPYPDPSDNPALTEEALKDAERVTRQSNIQ